MGLSKGSAKLAPDTIRQVLKQQQKDKAMIVEHQKESIDAEIAKCIGMNPKAGKAELKKQLVKTLVRAGHTRPAAIAMVKASWGKRHPHL